MAAILALMVPVCAQAKEVKVRNFNGIRAGNRFEVDVEKASKHALELTFPVELEEYVTAEVQSGVLVLTLDLEKAPRDIRREFNSGDWKLYASLIPQESCFQCSG